jgi:hypothetical protein
MRRSSLRDSVPIVTLGLLLVTFAMLLAPWPSDQAASNNVSVSYFERIAGKQIGVLAGQSGKTLVWYGRRVLDVLVFCMLVMGYGSMALLAWRNEYRALIALIAIGALGTLYAGFMGLYPGPILAAVGFALILFGAGLDWASHCAVEARHRSAVFGTVNHSGTGFERP